MTLSFQIMPPAIWISSTGCLQNYRVWAYVDRKYRCSMLTLGLGIVMHVWQPTAGVVSPQRLLSPAFTVKIQKAVEVSTSTECTVPECSSFCLCHPFSAYVLFWRAMLWFMLHGGERKWSFGHIILRIVTSLLVHAIVFMALLCCESLLLNSSCFLDISARGEIMYAVGLYPYP